MRTITSSTTLLSNDDIVIVNNTSGAALDVSLPAASDGKVYTIKRRDTAAFNVTIDPNGSETLEGNETFQLATDDCIEIVGDSGLGRWHILSRYVAPV